MWKHNSFAKENELFWFMLVLLNTVFKTRLNGLVILIIGILWWFKGFPRGSAVKNLSAMQDTKVRSLGREDLLKKGMATHSRILAWRILWTEEPGLFFSLRQQVDVKMQENIQMGRVKIRSDHRIFCFELGEPSLFLYIYSFF